MSALIEILREHETDYRGDLFSRAADEIERLTLNLTACRQECEGLSHNKKILAAVAEIQRALLDTTNEAADSEHQRAESVEAQLTELQAVLEAADQLLSKHFADAYALEQAEAKNTALLAMVVVPDEVSDKELSHCECGEHEHIYFKLTYVGSGKYDGWAVECNRCGYAVFIGLDRYSRGPEANPFLITAWNKAMLKAAKEGL